MTDPPPSGVGVRICGRTDERPALPLVVGAGRAEAIIWPGMGASHRSLHRFELVAGDATVPQQHPGEAAYHVNRGEVEVEDLDAAVSSPLREGSMIHIDPRTTYRLVARTDAEVIGGPCPPDPALYEHLGSDT